MNNNFSESIADELINTNLSTPSQGLINTSSYTGENLEEVFDELTSNDEVASPVFEELESLDTFKEEITHEDLTSEEPLSNHSVYNSISDIKVVSVREINSLMKQGYTRTRSTKGYDETIGSIQEYYNLNDNQIKLLFADPRLKHSRTSFAKRAEKTLIIED